MDESVTERSSQLTMKCSELTQDKGKQKKWKKKVDKSEIRTKEQYVLARLLCQLQVSSNAKHL